MPKYIVKYLGRFQLQSNLLNKYMLCLVLVAGLFSMEFGCSPLAFMGFLLVLQIPVKVKKTVHVRLFGLP